MTQSGDHVNWGKATAEERKALHQVAMAVKAASGLTLEQIFLRAFGNEVPLGHDDLNNSRKGTMSRRKAEAIYRWIAKRHLETAQAANPHMFGTPPGSAWEARLAEHANTNSLRIRLLNTRGLIERASEALPHDAILKLGQEFFFELTSDIEGTAIAFQGYKGDWHSLPLGAGVNIQAHVIQGQNILPTDTTGQPIPLIERNDSGLHRFAVVVVPEKHASLLKKFSPDFPPPRVTEHAHLHLLRVLIG